MDNIQSGLTNLKPFPSIKQSFIIVGIILLTTTVFAPVIIIAGFIPIAFIKEISFFSYYLLSFGTASYLAYLYKKYEEKHTYTHPQFKVNDYLLIPLLLIAAIALQIGVTIPVISLIPMPEFIKRLFEMMNKDMNNFWAFATVIALAPIFEEYIFRGVILNGLLKRISPFKAILISSLLFGLVHLNPWQFVSAMVIGLFAVWIYYRTKNLLLCMLIHFANNSWAVASSYIFSNQNTMNSYATNKAIFIVPALLVAIVCIYLLHLRINSKESKEAFSESIE